MSQKFKAVKPDPRILICQIIVISMLSFSFNNWTAIVLLFAIVDIITLFFVERGSNIKCLISFMGILCLQRLLQIVYIPFLSTIFAMFLIIVLKAIPVYMTVLILMRHTPMNELMAALRKLHIPMILLIPMAVMYRYIPTIRQESVYIHESLIMRGLNFSVQKIVKHPMSSIEHYFIPLLFRSEQITEELSAATLCKGLNAKKERTCCTEVKLRLPDCLYLIMLCIVTCILCYVNLHIELW